MGDERAAAIAYATTSRRGYRWEQTETEALLWIALESGIQTKAIGVEMHVQRVSVTIDGVKVLRDEELHAPIDLDESYWEVEEDDANDGRRSLKVVLTKRTGYVSWPYCLESENVTYDAATTPTTRSVYLDLEINGVPAGRITLGLFVEELPLTCANFRQLCCDNKYLGSAFHRVIPGFMLQGGDFTKGDGTGGMSIYGERFDDEGFCFNHTVPGLLSMANAGPDTNGSQFFITCKATPHLDGKHVVFGRILAGMDVVSMVEDLGSPSGVPSKQVTIVACGDSVEGLDEA